MGQDFINGDAAGGVEDEVIMLPIVIVVEVGFIGDLFLVFVGCINHLMAWERMADGGDGTKDALFAELICQGR